MAEDEPRRQVMQELKQPILFRAFPEPSTKTRTNGDMGQTSKSIECTNGTAAISTGDLHGFLHHVSVEQIHLCHVGPDGNQHQIPTHWRPARYRHEARRWGGKEAYLRAT